MKKIALAILVVVGGFIAAQVWLQRQVAANRSPTITKEIAHFKDTLDSETGAVSVRVYSIKKDSTGPFDAGRVRSFRVEFEVPNAQVLSPPLKGTGFAADTVETDDIDGDGTKELVLDDEDDKVGVVWLRDHKLEFRRDMDVLEDASSPKKADNGRMVFTTRQSAIFTNGSHGVSRPRLYVWSRQDGFKEATRQFPKYVRRILIPGLKKEMAAEVDVERQKNFQKVITELEDLTK